MDIFSYNLINRKHILYTLVSLKKDFILKKLLKKLELAAIKDIPFLFPGSGPDCKGETAFDVLVRDDKRDFV